MGSACGALALNADEVYTVSALECFWEETCACHVPFTSISLTLSHELPRLWLVTTSRHAELKHQKSNGCVEVVKV